MKKSKKVKREHYITHKELTVPDVFYHMSKGKERLQINKDMSVNLLSQRLVLFHLKGVVCVSCGRVGTVFKAQNHTKGDKGQPHLNLFTADGVLMTKDHILPKSKGGADHHSNYQTMCSPCNSRKGAKVPEGIDYVKSNSKQALPSS